MINRCTQIELVDLSCICLDQRVVKTAMNLQVDAFALLGWYAA